MSIDYGVHVKQAATSLSTPVVADSGIPFVVGTAPIQCATKPAKPFVPVRCTSWDEAVSLLGYSDDWNRYTLCEFMYSHFKLFSCQPVFFCNVLDSSQQKEDKEAADLPLTAHKLSLPPETLTDSVVVKAEGGSGEPYVLGTDYELTRTDDALLLEALPDGAFFSASTVQVGYSAIKPDAITHADIAEGLDAIDLCVTLFGTTADLICAPGYSGDPTIAALMAAKAGNINGLFSAKALIDIDTSVVTDYADVYAHKNSKNLVDKNQILCFPMVKLGDKKFHLSTQLAGLMAQIDAENECPYESPSNKNLQCDGAILQDGTEVNLALPQANILRDNGVVTALNFFDGWTAWGSYTACYPANTDVKDYFIPISRMFSWVGTTLIRSHWSKIDRPITRGLIDNIVDSVNIWLSGLVGSSNLLGARVEFPEGENPETNLMAGILKFHIYLTPPPPTQQIDFTLEYDVDYLATLFG